ncbi:MAG: exonuclease domain-containing protein [Pseudomonadota bacterium]
MRTQNKFWWFVALALCITTITFIILGVFFWQDLTPSEKDLLLSLVKNYPTYFFMGAILIIAAVGFALDGALNNYILPLNRMLEETRIILSANPAHRIRVDGSRPVQQLADLFNLMAGRIESIHDQVSAQVATARDESEREKTILAAMVSELPQGVIVCNMDHRIILYNRQAKRLFEDGDGPEPPDPTGAGTEHFLGLGRSIMGIVDGALIRFAMEDIRRNVARNDTGAACHFVTPGKNGRLIQSEMVPVFDAHGEFNGYILMFEDVTERMESRYRMSRLLEHLITKARASLAGIRSAIEFMVAFPDMDNLRRTRLRTIIRDEAVILSGILDESAAQLPAATRSSWPLTPVRLDDLFHALKQRCATGATACMVDMPPVGDALWVKADSYLLLTALGFIISRIVEHDGITRISVRGRIEDRFVHVDLVWVGTAVSMERLQKWQNASVRTDDTRLPMTLGQVIERHDGELIPCKPSCSDPSCTGLRILLPTLAPPPEENQKRSAAVLTTSRPEFYDFDLFNQPGQLPSTDSQPLEALTVTVFDTETTGLDPRGGDEIISIGAVRIVNQRLLREESFDQLVDPQRQIPWESVKFHGINQDMVAGKPTVDRVLAQFHRFAADTVLVAHNAAFDMRMLQMKEASSGIYFINPVLDTMLLSAVVHPSQKDHSLETIAVRLGVTVEGRHTALGDAITTAEVFLKLIPLLKQQGIRSLMEARRASQKTYFARMTY